MRALVVALIKPSRAFLESALDRPAWLASASMSSALFIWVSVWIAPVLALLLSISAPVNSIVSPVLIAPTAISANPSPSGSPVFMEFTVLESSAPALNLGFLSAFTADRICP